MIMTPTMPSCSNTEPDVSSHVDDKVVTMMLVMRTMVLVAMMMLTMPTSSDAERGLDVSGWVKRPVVDHLRVLLLRLRDQIIKTILTLYH